MVNRHQGQTAACAFHHGSKVLMRVLRAAINDYDRANSRIGETLHYIFYSDRTDFRFYSIEDHVA